MCDIIKRDFESRPGPISVRFAGLIMAAVLFAAVAAPYAASVSAQTDPAGLTVVVVREISEGTQEPVAGVKVTVTGSLNTRECPQTDAAGNCTFGALEPDMYRITSDPEAIEPLDVVLAPGQRITRTLTLPAIPKSETDSDKAAPPFIPQPTPQGTPDKRETRLVIPAESVNERTFADRRGVIARLSEVVRRPNSEEGFASVLQTQPGVTNAPASTSSTFGFNINALPDRENVLRVEGISVIPPSLRDASYQDTGALIFDVSKRQSIQDYSAFSANTNNTPAKLGTGTGGQLIKSVGTGGDKIHGEFYEYFSHDRLSARDFFDFARKPSLRFNLFGFKLSGPLPAPGGEDATLAYFFNYEGVRASSGRTIYEAAPSLSLMGRADPAVVPLLESFRDGGATIVTGASQDSNFDILRLDGKNSARKDSATLRLDYTPDKNKGDAFNFIYLSAYSREETPESVSGRRLTKTVAGQTGIFRYKRFLKGESSDSLFLTNDFIFGVKADPSRLNPRLPRAGGTDLSRAAFSVGGKVPQLGIVGIDSQVAQATPGGLLRGASDFTGHKLRFNPKSVSFVDQLTWAKSVRSTYTFGGEVRLLRYTIDRLFGATYQFGNLDDFLANRLSSVEFVGDLGSFNGNPGERSARQNYYIGYAQQEYKSASTDPRHITLTYGLRYEYYSVMREARDRAVVFDTDAGVILPAGAQSYRSRHNFLPRISFAWGLGPTAPDDDRVNDAPTVFSASFGMHVGPDAIDTLLRSVYSDRISVSQEGGAFPADTSALASSFAADTARQYKPLAIARDYSSPAILYKYDVTTKFELAGRKAKGAAGKREVLRELYLTLSYTGNRGRNLPFVNFANRITGVRTNPDPTRPTIVTREFDGVAGDGSLLKPFGEIEFYTSGGRSAYDSLQVKLDGAATSRLLRFFEAQYTLARSRGNTDPDSPIGLGNTAELSYDLGYNSADVRHNFSFAAVFSTGCDLLRLCKFGENKGLSALLADWTFAAVGGYQSGSPIDLRVKRPDVVYRDAEGHVFSSPAAGRQAVLNLPAGGASVAALRPDLVPGVNPYLGEFADRLFLNPAAFAIPAPGTFGNLTRGALRGPSLRFFDVSLRKEFFLHRKSENMSAVSLVFNVDVNNVFNFTNFKFTSASLPDALGFDGTSAKLQPGQPFTTDAAASTFGVITRTYKRKQDLGSGRQIQFRLGFLF